MLMFLVEFAWQAKPKADPISALLKNIHLDCVGEF